MRKRGLRIAALLLALILFAQMGVLAAEQREKIGGLEIPDTWAHDALYFAVENGILSGKGTLGLCPADYATRAEMAAMIVRIIGAQPQESPMSFTDCKPDAWFYGAMSAAVGRGIIYGTTETTLSPNMNVTREQAFTIIARAFRLSGGDKALLNSFTDSSKIGTYAVDAMACLVQAGYLKGTNGMLRPKNNISRQELAQILYQILGDIYRDDSEAKTEYANLLYASQTPLPAGTVIHGDLIIPCDAPQNISLEGVTVEGRLVVLGSTQIDGGSFAEAEICADCTISGEIGTLRICENGCKVVLNATADSTEITARHAELSGSGNAGAVTNYGIGTTVSCSYASYVEKIDAGLDGLRATQTYVPVVTRKEKNAKVVVYFDNIDTTHLYGVDEEGRRCTLGWYVNGVLAGSTEDFLLTNGAQAEKTLEIPFYKNMDSAVPASVKVTYGTETKSFPLQITADNRDSEAYYTAEAIPTVHVLAKIIYNCTAANGTRLKAGDTVYFMGENGYVQIPGGRFTYIPEGSYEIWDKVYTNNSINYSKEVLECFVNEVHDYASKSGYLIWCNLYTQHVYIFKGSEGRWTLFRQSQCTSGSNYSPTRPGVYKIYGKNYRWDFDYIDDVSTYYVLYPSLFDGGIAFHTRTKMTDGSGWLDSRLGYMLSHGCVRLPDDMAKFIYDYCPVGTTVVVW